MTNHTDVITLPTMIESCVRCSAPAAIVMVFSYGDAVVWLDDLAAPTLPGAYAMCEEHGGRLTPPVGWTLVDRRSGPRRLFASLEVA